MAQKNPALTEQRLERFPLRTCYGDFDNNLKSLLNRKLEQLQLQHTLFYFDWYYNVNVQLKSSGNSPLRPNSALSTITATLPTSVHMTQATLAPCRLPTASANLAAVQRLVTVNVSLSDLCLHFIHLSIKFFLLNYQTSLTLNYFKLFMTKYTFSILSQILCILTSIFALEKVSPYTRAQSLTGPG